jgi:hypothetical protein
MYKSRQEINTGEYHLPCYRTRMTAHQPLNLTPWGDDNRRRLACSSRVVLRQTYSRRAEMDSAQPVLHDARLRSLTLDGVWLVGESQGWQGWLCFR